MGGRVPVAEAFDTVARKINARIELHIGWRRAVGRRGPEIGRTSNCNLLPGIKRRRMIFVYNWWSGPGVAVDAMLCWEGGVAKVTPPIGSQVINSQVEPRGE